MKRTKKDSKNKVIYFDNKHAPKSAHFIVRTLDDGSIRLEHHPSQNEENVALADFPANSFDVNEIGKTLKKCHQIIGSNHTLYAEMPKWMRKKNSSSYSYRISVTSKKESKN